MQTSILPIERLERALQTIPLTLAMRVEIRRYDGEHLILAAPLEPNVNDKGCAFGGSLASLMTLSGWGLIVLKLEEAQLDCDIYVQDSSIRYLAPLWSELKAQATIVGSWDAFINSLRARGRARLSVTCRATMEDGGDACTLDARFVAIVRNATDTP